MCAIFQSPPEDYMSFSPEARSRAIELYAQTQQILGQLLAVILNNDAAAADPSGSDQSAWIANWSTPISPLPLPNTPDAPTSTKVRWRYVPGTWYHIIGGNPFREGNNFNLFEFLANRYGNRPFSREDLGEAIAFLRTAGAIDSVQDEEQIVLVFLRTAGTDKNRIGMTSAPAPGENPEPLTDAAGAIAAIPVTGGEPTYELLGEIPFRSGVNVAIWEGLGNTPFERSRIQALVESLVEAGQIESIRPAETIVRDFLGRVQEKGRLKRS